MSLLNKYLTCGWSGSSPRFFSTTLHPVTLHSTWHVQFVVWSGQEERITKYNYSTEWKFSCSQRIIWNIKHAPTCFQITQLHFLAVRYYCPSLIIFLYVRTKKTVKHICDTATKLNKSFRQYPDSWGGGGEGIKQKPDPLFLNRCATTFRIQMHVNAFNNSSQSVATTLKSYSVLFCHLIGLCCCFFVKLLLFCTVI
jgi:hypothetical protein